MDVIGVFDVSSYYNNSTPDGVWYRQTRSGDTYFTGLFLFAFGVETL